MNTTKRKVLGAVLAGSSLMLTAATPAMASEPPVETQPCPPGYYGVQVYIQQPSGDRKHTICVFVG
ncbi:MAG TPA: hypothetical protein VHN37_14140 [Actinomycetota bacterium]|nr:hypothetical protein [Actinomycetota bacterium]